MVFTDSQRMDYGKQKPQNLVLDDRRLETWVIKCKVEIADSSQRRNYGLHRNNETNVHYHSVNGQKHSSVRPERRVPAQSNRRSSPHGDPSSSSCRKRCLFTFLWVRAHC